MTINIEAPTMGESITEATIASWVKQEGDAVAEDELIAELETDKINLEVTAPKAGVLGKILKGEGETVTVGEVMAELNEGGEASSEPAEEKKAEEKKAEEPQAEPAPAAAPASATSSTSEGDMPLSPAVVYA